MLPGFYEYEENSITTICEVFNDVYDGPTVLFLGDEEHYRLEECKGKFGDRIGGVKVDGIPCNCNLCTCEDPIEWDDKNPAAEEETPETITEGPLISEESKTFI